MKFLITLLLLTGLTLGNPDGKITVECSSKSLSISIDEIYKDTVFYDDEGFNRYFHFEDGSFLDIRCGGLADNQYLNDTLNNEIWKECISREDRVVSGVVKESGNRWIYRKMKGSRLSISGVSQADNFTELESIVMGARLLDN